MPSGNFVAGNGKTPSKIVDFLRKTDNPTGGSASLHCAWKSVFGKIGTNQI